MKAERKEVASRRSRAGPPIRLLTIVAAAALGACGPTVAAGDLTAFGTAAGAIGKQADLTFQQSNKLARDVSVNRFIRSGAPGLNEAQFAVAVSADDIAAWQSALGNLERYGAALASLVDTRRGTSTSDALLSLGQQLRDGGTGVSISPGVASAFASLGGALIDQAAQRSARDVLVRTDPEVQALLGQMVEALGAHDREGLRGTVATNWAASFDGVRRAYALAATERNEAQQRQLVGEFLGAIDRRDAQLRSMAALRSSLLNLASAHAAAAKGSPSSIGSLLAAIDTRLSETKRLYDAFAEREPETNAGEPDND